MGGNARELWVAWRGKGEIRKAGRLKRKGSQGSKPEKIRFGGAIRKGV